MISSFTFIEPDKKRFGAFCVFDPIVIPATEPESIPLVQIPRLRDDGGGDALVY